jgi:Cu(I)/Ag(I) efflux system membrane fusion protein
MRKFINTGLLLAAASILFTGCGQKTAHDEHNQHATHQASESEKQRLAHFVDPTTTKVVSSQRVVKPEQALHSNVFNAYGYVALDERRSSQVAARMGGRIEKLHVKYEHQYVRKGEKILDLYSPDLNTFQEELLFAQKVDPDGETPKHAAHKLKLLGITDRQIQTILETGKTSYTLSIYSPNDGYIFYNPSSAAPVPSSSMTSTPRRGTVGGGMAMGGGSPQASTSQAMSVEGPIREGAYVSAGQTLFWINDLRQVWGILSFDEMAPGAIAVNDSVSVSRELMPENPVKFCVRRRR